jgi:hypothetical protein
MGDGVAGKDTGLTAYDGGFFSISKPSGWEVITAGAGAQRCDPKSGDPGDYPHGHGPQGDVVRIFNYVRLVRDAETDAGGKLPDTQSGMRLETAPNPFASSVRVSFTLPGDGQVTMKVFNAAGERLATLLDGYVPAGEHQCSWQPAAMPNGVYFCTLEDGRYRQTVKVLCIR